MLIEDITPVSKYMTAFVVQRGKVKTRVLAPKSLGLKEGDVIRTERCVGVNGVDGWFTITVELGFEHKQVQMRKNIQQVLDVYQLPQEEQFEAWQQINTEQKTYALIQGKDPNKIKDYTPFVLLGLATVMGWK
ncbi:hypothetical protein VPHD491_0048 [Vibrio phage D491]